MNIKRAKATSYAEESQITKDTFSVAYEKDGELIELFSPIKCREFFSDFFGSLLSPACPKLTGTIYSFEYKKYADEVRANDALDRLYLLHYGTELSPDAPIVDKLLPGHFSNAIAIAFYTAELRNKRVPSITSGGNSHMPDKDREYMDSILMQLIAAGEALGLDPFYLVAPTFVQESNYTLHARGVKNFLAGTRKVDADIKAFIAGTYAKAA